LELWGLQLFSNVFYFTTSKINPRFLGSGILRSFLLVRSLIKAPLELNLTRLSDAINFSRVDIPAGNFNKSIELIFVAIKKDFSVLISSVIYARNSIGKYQSGGTRVIVPDAEVVECKEILLKNGLYEVEVVPESSLISSESLQLLRRSFSSRANWVLQQVLKVQSVLTSKADAALIVDSDTLLLTERSWFSASGTQLLTPSYEFNAPYYEFLEKLSLCSSQPKYTFISHHMLMQPEQLRITFADLHWRGTDELVRFICENAQLELDSPVCVEYELYSQSLLTRSPEKVHFGLWGNISISRSHLSAILSSKLIMRILTRCFHSASFHSWSEK
jgi:hypothetical protein